MRALLVRSSWLVSPAQRWQAFCTFAVAFLVVSPAAWAGGQDAKERAAKRACLSGDYAKGVALLSDLYIDTDDPTYIFNQGRCFEQNGRYQDAITRFREYLRKIQDAGHHGDPSTERHIADCEALLAKERGQAPKDATPASPPIESETSRPAKKTVELPPLVAPEPPSAPAPISSQAAPLPAPPTPASQPESEVTSTAAGARPGSGLRVIGIVGMGLGVAAIATGAVLAVKANDVASELEASPTSYERGKESTRSRYATLSNVGYAVGGACVVGGAVLYYLGWRAGHSASMALVPAFTSASAGAVVQGAF